VKTRVLRTRALGSAALAAGVLVGATGCTSGAPAAADPTSSASAAPTTSSHAPGTAVLAFAGDVHFEGASASTADLGDAFGVLAGADLAVVNLETAVTTGGTRVDKQFAFRAPPAAMTALRDAGVDAVSLANNHGVDYGLTGLRDTLAAGREAGLPVLGAGDDVDAAFTPLRAEPGGVPVSVIAATDVIDSSVETAWTATATTAGLATAKDSDRLLADVRGEAADGRVVVVVLHWGTERMQCPTQRQRELAADLAEAGAAVVVGSHAHVLEPTATVDGAFVAYGLGNFHFYAKPGNTLGTQTGVMTVEVDRDGVVGSEWHPAAIRDGKPELLTAEQLAGSSRGPDELAELGERCAAGAVATPSRTAVPGTGGADGADGADGGDDGSAADPGEQQSPSSAPTSAPGGTAPSAEPSASPAPSAAAPTATAGGAPPTPSTAPA